MKRYMIGILLCLGLTSMNEAWGQSANVTKLETAFENEELTGAQLQAFELRALQKLNDLASYIEVMGNNALSPRLRDQATEQFLTLFSDSSRTILFPGLKNVPTVIKAHELAKSISGLSLESVSAKVSQQKVTRHFKRQSERQYAAVAACKMAYSFLDAGGKVRSNIAISYQVQLVLSRKEKQFGQHIKEIWEVSLGDVRSLD